MKVSILELALAAAVVAHGDHNQLPISGPHKSLWYNTLPGDGGTQVSVLFVERSKLIDGRPTLSSLASQPSAV